MLRWEKKTEKSISKEEFESAIAELNAEISKAVAQLMFLCDKPVTVFGSLKSHFSDQ